MSAFRALKDISNNFEAELRRVSAELFVARVGESFEEMVAKKMRDLSLYTSKMRLLRAKPLSSTPQITQKEKDDTSVAASYGELVTWTVVERQVVKSITQAHAVKTLLSTPNKRLDPEMVERKEKIIAAITEYRNKESTLLQLDTVLSEKIEEQAAVRAAWDKELAELEDKQEGGSGVEVEDTGLLYKKLSTYVDKLELMRWLICRLASPRTGDYDWQHDPHRRLASFKMAREVISIDKLLEN